MRASANTVILLLLVVSAALGLAPFLTCAAALRRRSHRLGLAVTVLVPSMRASRRLGLAASVVVRFHSILADTRLHILREDHRFVALRGSEAVSMLVGLHVLGANTFIVFRNLGVRAGRRRLGLAFAVLDSVVTFNALGLLLVEYLFVSTGRGRLGLALSVLDSVVAFDTDVLVLVEDLFVSALRSADVLVVWLEAIAMVGRVGTSASCTSIIGARPDLLLVDAHTVTFVVPRLILGALHDAHVLVVFVAKSRSKLRISIQKARPNGILRTVPCTDTCWSTC